MTRIAVILIVGVMIGGCATSDQATPNATETASAASGTAVATPEDEGIEGTRCTGAFAQAAAVDEMQDTIEDLYPAVEACSTLEDWVAASNANPGAVAEGVDPLTVLGNICGNNEDLIGEDLCQQAQEACESDSTLQATMVCLLEL